MHSRTCVSFILCLVIGWTSTSCACWQAEFSNRDGIWKPTMAVLGGMPLPVELLNAISLKLNGEHYVVTINGKTESDSGICVVDATTVPQRMTIKSTEGANKGKTLLAIFEITGDDSMRVCYDLAGKAFPVEFKSEAANPMHYLVEYRREAKSEELTGTVVEVAGGDILTITTADKKKLQIRLNAIDAPEPSQPGGEAAKNMVTHLVLKQSVRVVTHGNDRAGKTIGDVFFRPEKSAKSDPDANLNFIMVANGYAWHYVRFAADNKELASAEKNARELKLGLWAEQSPISPWDWRKQEADKAKAKQ